METGKIDYEGIRQAILAADSIEQLKRSANMPPVPPCAENQNFVFISYSHQDYKAVYCDLLEFYRAGLPYWYDMGLPAGEDWEAVVESKIRQENCTGVIFYMSENLFLSRSVNKEIAYTVSGGEDGAGAKNYFCINLTDMPPLKIIHTIQRNRDYDALEQSGFIDCLPCLVNAFSNKSTYISKADAQDRGHIPQVLEQSKDRFQVVAAGVPLENDRQMQKMAKDLEFAKCFAIKDNVLKSYMGTDTEVIIPDYITEIGNAAFKDCDSVTRVVIPPSVTRIGADAFYYCRRLADCVIPDSVTYIGQRAFEFCRCMYYDDRDNVGYVGNWAVEGCLCRDDYVMLKNGTVGVAEKILDKPENTNIILPPEMTDIHPYSFRDYRYLKGVWLNKGIRSIGEGAFSGCTDMERILLPDSIVSIGKEAFYRCVDLKEIKLPSGLTTLGGDAFVWCAALTELVLPNSITTWLGDLDLTGCGALERIVLPENLRVIGQFAFSNCASLQTLKIPESVTVIGSRAFDGCSSLRSIIIPQGVQLLDIGIFSNCFHLTEVQIPDSVTAIKTFAFASCKSLSKITIPGSVVSIERFAFFDCKALMDIHYCGTMEAWQDIDKGSDWDEQTPFFAIHCTDGDILKI